MVNGVSSEFSNLIRELQYFGVFDVIIPFLLVFTVVFAILQRTKIFGTDRNNVNIMVALIMGILTVVPHLTGNYPGRYDPVLIINALLPSVSVLIIAIILVLILVGMFAGEWGAEQASVVVFIVALAFIGYVFGTTVGWWSSPSQIFRWWGSSVTYIVVGLLAMAVIVYFVKEKKTPGDRIGDFVRKAFRGPRS